MHQIPNLSIEGDDGSGKLTAVLATIKGILENTNHEVIFGGHPSYWSTGQFIKRMNRGGANELFDTLSGSDQTRIRCAAFALDRLFTLAMYLQVIEKLENPTLIFDRGPYSNAVTLGVMVAQGLITMEQADEFIREVLPSVDLEILAETKVQPILCTPEDINQTAMKTGERITLDDYESLDNRNPISEIYRKVIKTKPIITKSAQGWRDPNDIASDILNAVDINVLHNSVEEPSNVIDHHRDTGRLVILGPELFVNTILGERATEYLDSRSDNYDSELNFLFEEWIRITVTEPQSLQFPKDLWLDQLEKEISTRILKLMLNSPIPNPNIPPEVITGMKRLTSEHPELWDVMQLCLGEESEGMITLIQNIIALGEEV